MHIWASAWLIVITILPTAMRMKTFRLVIAEIGGTGCLKIIVPPSISLFLAIS
jgi:hypothetical protein